MSAASVAEPFLLSSYPESSAHRKRKLAPLHASPPSSSDVHPFVTVAVQGDGIHVLDTTTLHPAASQTLGPSTFFSCPPATRTSQNNPGVRICTTYAVLESGPDVQPEGKGKTVVAWEENLSGSTLSGIQGEKRKRVAVAPHSVVHLYAPEYLLDREVLVSSAGEISLADEELRVLRTYTPQNQQTSTLVKHFLFPAVSCSLLPSHTIANYAAISVSFLRSGEVLRFSVVGLDQENLTSLAECVVPIEETADVLDISCSSQGFISVLFTSGTWLALSVSTSATSSLTITHVAEPLRLQNLTFVNSTRTSEISLSALASSHVLLSAVTIGSVPEIVLLLWDLRYGVLLSQQSISVPSTLPRPKKHGAVLKLLTSPAVQPTSGASKASAINLNALLVLLPVAERDMQAETGTRSTLLVVPLTVPLTSTIAAAMGKAHTGAKWVSPKSGQGQQAQGLPARGAPEMGVAARKVLREMKAALDGSANGSTAGAEGVYFEYVKQQSKGKATAQSQGQGQGQDVEGQSTTPMDYPFVQGVLELVLRLPTSTSGFGEGKTPKAGAYSPQIVTHLLENRMVSSSMVEGGMLPALAARNDWNAVGLAMRTVTDLPENDVVSLLSQVVKADRHASSADEDAMVIDSAPSTSIPPLPTYLGHCIVYPFTPALQRTALRKHIPDAADLTSILEVLDTWLVQHTENDALLSPAADSSESPNSEPTPAGIPPLDKILAFLQTLLDASFLALLAHTPAHTLLRALAAHIQPALASAQEVELLCGPLEPFARAAKARALTEAKEGKDGKGDGRDWRRRRKLAHEQAGMAVGLYQVEELVL